MSDDRTPEEQLAEVALAALSEGLYAFEHENQLQARSSGSDRMCWGNGL